LICRDIKEFGVSVFLCLPDDHFFSALGQEAQEGLSLLAVLQEVWLSFFLLSVA
jgi:hypothetical protein